MSLERRIEFPVRCLVLAPGLLLAPFVLPPSVIIVLLVSSGLVVGLSVSLMRPARQDDARVQPRWPYYCAALGRATGASLAVVSLTAVATISVTMAVLLLPVLMLCSSTVRAWLQARLVRASQAAMPTQSESMTPAQARPSVGVQDSIDPQQLTSMTNGELCLAWRTSYVVLQQAPSPLERSRVVAWRHACLDEFDSRHPEALADWLGSGARAASGPDRFLPRGPDRAA